MVRTIKSYTAALLSLGRCARLVHNNAQLNDDRRDVRLAALGCAEFLFLTLVAFAANQPLVAGSAFCAGVVYIGLLALSMLRFWDSLTDSLDVARDLPYLHGTWWVICQNVAWVFEAGRLTELFYRLKVVLHTTPQQDPHDERNRFDIRVSMRNTLDNLLDRRYNRQRGLLARTL